MNKKRKILPNMYMGFILLFLYIPIALVIGFSFNNSSTSIRWEGFTWRWYGEMMKDKDLFESLFVSLKVAFSSVFISAVIGTLGAVSLSSLNKYLKRLISGLSNVPLIVPEVIMGVAILLFFSSTPLNFGIFSLSIAHSTFCIPYIIIMVNIRLNAIDPSVTEAAKDLGASKFQVFTTITLPLIAPGIITGCLLAFAMSMDDVIISFFLTGARDTTLPVRIYSMLKIGISPKINALCTLLLVCTFLIVGFVQILGSKKKEQ